MSLFPYNNRKAAGYGSQGSPLHFDRAHELAYEVFWWHTQIAETDAWTQSASAAEGEINDIALGFLTMLAEPSFIQMLEDVGESTRRRIDTCRALYKNGHQRDDVYDALKSVGVTFD